MRDRLVDVPAAPEPEALLTERLESFDGKADKATEAAGREPVAGALKLVEM